MKLHELKILHKYLVDISIGKKTFEITIHSRRVLSRIPVGYIIRKESGNILRYAAIKMVWKIGELSALFPCQNFFYCHHRILSSGMIVAHDSLFYHGFPHASIFLLIKNGSPGRERNSYKQKRRTIR